MAYWYTAGVQTNPAGGTVLADTGPLPASGGRPFKVILASTVGLGFTVEHRNAANNATLTSQNIPVTSNQPVELEFAPGPDMANDDERLRVVTNALAVGQVQASLLVQS